LGRAVTPEQRAALQTELIRAHEAIEHAEHHAPAGLSAQWAQLAKVRIQNAEKILKDAKP